MEYNIPPDIEILCAKTDLSNENEQEKVKVEIVNYLKRYLDKKDGKNSFVDVTGIIRDIFKCQGTQYSFDRDIGGRMQRTRDFTMREAINEGNGKEVYVIAADRDWWDKYSGWVSIVLLVIGFILGLIGEPIRDKIFTKTKPTNIDTLSIKVLSLPQQEQPHLYQHNLQQIPEILKTDSTTNK